MIRTIRLTVIPESKKNRVISIGEDNYQIYLKAKPEHNQANALLIQALAEYFAQPLSAFRIVTGRRSTHKRVDIQVS